MKLVIGNKNYSSWSLRGWLAAKAAGLPFEEVLIDLDGPGTAAEIGAHSPSGRVPALIDGDVVVWDSLAIGEYLAEKAPAAGLWPADAGARAFARSIVAEMHAGFGALRNHMPMNIRRPPAPRPPDDAVAADVARIAAIWREARGRFGTGGPYLFGRFTLADCAYAPVASRFATYSVPLDDVCAAYVESVLSHPAMVEWSTAARAETWVVAADEVD
ncbi:glutathione S-transferase family protein [Oharaeibacter diazotrophicus]|uniref:Glutathione S-transferase n=1 Tax=Oharaeibacter diazotrophicus TaxID=1920512 RepID=A0A4R6RJH5_9HYPH|nr:glutathione S-transferase family protein [Oharaeibacter diazotrophicus]TDP86574.1 glutathione S-transferase [Oharaeibacter diazotrophicus]BBE71484.1 dichloromethane dehalogenase [Pleomorphomonas sp. SM30]GLS78245.1 glutathione S-transferase [Oharaeibacter diazotrophicus]